MRISNKLFNVTDLGIHKQFLGVQNFQGSVSPQSSIPKPKKLISFDSRYQLKTYTLSSGLRVLTHDLEKAAQLRNLAHPPQVGWWIHLLMW